MANIKPFRAVRPSRNKVAHVCSNSYEKYTKKELEVNLKYNPYSFLHILNPGFKYHRETSGNERFNLVKNRYLEFKESAIFRQDKEPSFYIHTIESREGKFTGIIAGVSTEDYANNVVKKHEYTLEKREKLFKDYLRTVGFNAEAVLLTYKDNESLDTFLKRKTKERPEYEFTTLNKENHYLWIINDPKEIQFVQSEFHQKNTLYIADGHHRSASSFLLSTELKNENNSHSGEENYNYFMSYLIPESQLKISSFNRLISDLNGLSKEKFLTELDRWYRIENRGKKIYTPSKPHHFSMYLDGDFYSLYLRKSIYKYDSPLDELDAVILSKTILNPILGIENERDNHRISTIPDINGGLDLINNVDNEKFALGFSLFSVDINQLKNIADHDLKMPPKTTYIQPKLLSALTIYEF